MGIVGAASASAELDDDCPTEELGLFERRRAAGNGAGRDPARSAASAPGYTQAHSVPTIDDTADFCPPAREVAVGSILRSRYILEQVIGRGGDSIVFRARDLHRVSADESADNVLAIKVLLPERRTNAHALTRLKREFRQMQCLSHPGIVRVFDLDCDGDIWFMSMELVAAQTVKARMRAPVSHAEAVRIIAACCEALEYAHSRDILHGDLKPSNVLIAEHGGVKLIDFGSAPSPGSHIASGSDPSVAATHSYASPQILAGSSAERSDDIFSLACLSYGILSGGAHPFGPNSSLDACHAPLVPTYVATIPTRLYEVIARGLSAERERRPASVGEFLRDLTGTGLCRCSVSASAAVTAAPAMPGSGPEAHSRPTASIEDLWPEDGIGAGTLIAIGERLGGGRGAYWRVGRLRRMLPLFVLALGMAVMVRYGTQPGVLRTRELPPQLPAAAADSGATAAAAVPMQPDPAVVASAVVLPQTRPAPDGSGIISFEGSAIRASAAQSLVAISVKRLQSTRGPAAFAWRIERGTALPEVDYEPVAPQVVRFNEGQAVRSLFIALLNSRAPVMAREPRSFTVTLEKTAGGPELGRFARVTVTIDPAPGAMRYGAYQVGAGR